VNKGVSAQATKAVNIMKAWVKSSGGPRPCFLSAMSAEGAARKKCVKVYPRCLGKKRYDINLPYFILFNLREVDRLFKALAILSRSLGYAFQAVDPD
jgi:hypothetical protein